MSDDATIHWLIKEDMDRGVAEMRRILETAMFQPSPFVAPPPAPTPKWKRAWWRVRGYVWTLWQAIKGADLVERSDYDDY